MRTVETENTGPRGTPSDVEGNSTARFLMKIKVYSLVK
jgi:hypothetical protein